MRGTGSERSRVSSVPLSKKSSRKKLKESNGYIKLSEMNSVTGSSDNDSAEEKENVSELHVSSQFAKLKATHGRGGAKDSRDNTGGARRGCNKATQTDGELADEAMRAAMGEIRFEGKSVRGGGFESLEESSYMIRRTGSQKRIKTNPLHLLLAKANKTEKVPMPEGNICRVLENAMEEKLRGEAL